MYLTDKDGVVIKEIDPKENRIVVQSLEDIQKKGRALSKLENSTKIKYRFAKVNVLNIGEVKRVAPFFIDLILYISYFDNILRFENGIKINASNIGLVYGKKNFSKQRGGKLVKTLIDEDIVHKYGVGKNSYLVGNPWICYCGKTIQIDVSEEFKETKWKRGDY